VGGGGGGGGGLFGGWYETMSGVGLWGWWELAFKENYFFEVSAVRREALQILLTAT
jgi:hypothetical protein